MMPTASMVTWHSREWRIASRWSMTFSSSMTTSLHTWKEFVRCWSGAASMESPWTKTSSQSPSLGCRCLCRPSQCHLGLPDSRKVHSRHSSWGVTPLPLYEPKMDVYMDSRPRPGFQPRQDGPNSTICPGTLWPGATGHSSDGCLSPSLCRVCSPPGLQPGKDMSSSVWLTLPYWCGDPLRHHWTRAAHRRLGHVKM